MFHVREREREKERKKEVMMAEKKDGMERVIEKRRWGIEQFLAFDDE